MKRFFKNAVVIAILVFAFFVMFSAIHENLIKTEELQQIYQFAKVGSGVG